MPASSSVSNRAAHIALAAAFASFGVVDGTFAARLPALKHKLALDSGRLSLVVFAGSVAATLALPIAGWLTSRYGSRGPAAFGMVLAAGSLAAAAFAPSLGVLATVSCLLGAGFGIADVGANAQGVALEARVGRPLLSPLHAAWSFGLLGGSAITAASAAGGVGIRAQLPATALAVVVAVALSGPRLLPGTKADVDTAHLALPRGTLALPALLMLCALYVESAAMNWSAVFLNGPAGASAAVGASAVVAYAASMGVVRLVGDRLTQRWGVGGLALRSGFVSSAGIVLAIATRAPAPSLVGFALVGVGSAAIVPALFRVGGQAAGVSHGAGVAAVATAGYVGGIISGPIIGFLARGVGLSGALVSVAVAGLAVAALGPRLGSRA